MMMRFDSKGRTLEKGEFQTDSGLYRFVFYENGVKRIYQSRRLTSEDSVSVGMSYKMSIQEFRVQNNL